MDRAEQKAGQCNSLLSEVELAAAERCADAVAQDVQNAETIVTEAQGVQLSRFRDESKEDPYLDGVSSAIAVGLKEKSVDSERVPTRREIV